MEGGRSLWSQRRICPLGVAWEAAKDPESFLWYHRSEQI